MADEGPIAYAELAGYGLDKIAALAKAPSKVEGLNELGVHNVLDLLTHYPRRYLDRTKEARIKDLHVGDEAMVIAKVARIQSRRTRGRPPKVLVTADITDGSGYLKVTFFNQGWRERQLPPGTEAVFFGKVDSYQGVARMDEPGLSTSSATK